MIGRMLWRGDWAPLSELEARLETLGDTLCADLSLRYDMNALLRAADRVSQRLLADPPKPMVDALVASGHPQAGALNVLRSIGEICARSALRTKLMRELGTHEPRRIRRADPDKPIFEAWAPLGVLGHVASGNSAMVAPFSALEGLLTGNINLVKLSSKEGDVASLVLKALVDADDSGSLAPFLYALPLSSTRKDLLTKVFAECDGVAVYGGEDAVASVKELAPRNVRVIPWGHRLSFAYATRARAEDAATLEGLARDICENEQQSCTSPQCVFLDTSDREELNRFAAGVARALGSVSATRPQRLVEPAAAAEVTTATHLAELESVLGEARVLEGADRTWRVLVDYKPGLTPSPLYRTIRVKPLPRAEVVSALRPLRAYLQTVGLACAPDELEALGERFIEAGVTRIVPVGAQLVSYSGEPHDGVYALPRYCRRIAVQTTSEGADVFADFETAPPSHRAAFAG